MIEIVTTRNLELETLDRRIRGHKQSTKFKKALNQRWSALNDVVKGYNKEIDTLAGLEPGADLPRKLDVESLKTMGISNDEIWDIDRLLTREDWAVFPEVRNGIDAMFRVDRAQEEMVRLQLEVERMLHWLERQSSAILRRLSLKDSEIVPDDILPRRTLYGLLLERLRMVQSFARIKPGTSLLNPTLMERYISRPFLLTIILALVIYMIPNPSIGLEEVLKSGCRNSINEGVQDLEIAVQNKGELEGDMQAEIESDVEEGDDIGDSDVELEGGDIDEAVGAVLAAEGVREDLEEKRAREACSVDNDVASETENHIAQISDGEEGFVSE